MTEDQKSRFRVGVLGASGRSGSHALTKINTIPELVLGAAVVSSASSFLGKEAAPQVRYESLSEEIMGRTDGWIDFSTPDGTVALLEKCSKKGFPVVIATTGFSPDQKAKILEHGSKSPILFAPNTSIGVFALRESSKLVKQIVGEDFDIEIVENHHRGKKDAPSGTALMLAQHLVDQDSHCVYDRASRHEQRKKNDIGIASLRGGDVAAEHTIYFLGNGQQLELTHRVRDRAIFAEGALHLLNILRKKKAGIYELSKDFFGL